MLTYSKYTESSSKNVTLLRRVKNTMTKKKINQSENTNYLSDNTIFA